MPGPADLTAVVDGDIKGLKDQLGRATEALRSFERESNTRLDKITKGFDQLSRVGGQIKGVFDQLKSVALYSAPIVAINQLTKASADAVKDLRALGDEASGLSVSTDFLQSLRLLGENNGVEESSITSAVKAYGAALTELKAESGNLKDNLAGVDDALLAKLETPLQRAQLAAKLFGEENQFLSRALRGGSEGLAAFQAESIRTGQVLDANTIAKAREMELEFGSLSRALDNQFKEALVELAPILLSTSSLMKRLASDARDVFDGVGTISALSLPADMLGFKQLEERSFALQYQIAGVNKEIAALMAQGGEEPDVVASLAYAETRADALKKKLAEVNALLDRKAGEGVAPGSPPLPPAGADKPGVTAIDPRIEGARALAEVTKKLLQQTQQTSALIKFEYDQELLKFQELLKKKAITNAEFETARQQLAAISSAKLAEAAAKELQPISDAIKSNLETAFATFVAGGKVDFQELTRSILIDLAKIAFRMAVIQPLFGGAPGQPATGGAFGQLLAGVFHEGGVAGEGGGRTRSVSPAVFAGAKRYHTGGIAGIKPGERGVIVEDGEGIFTPEQMKALGRGAAGDATAAPSQTVNIINQSGGEAREERRRTSSGDEIIDIVISRVKDDMARGRFDAPMSGRFGVKPNTRGT